MIRRDHLTLRVFRVEKQCRLTVPVAINSRGFALFGNAHVTPGRSATVRGLCTCVAVTFLTESGRLLSRVDAPGSGNVLLRRTQYRWADLPDRRASVARCVVAGKVHNSRNLILRAARETTDPIEQKALQTTAGRLADVLPTLDRATDADVIRGHEGDAASASTSA